MQPDGVQTALGRIGLAASPMGFRPLIVVAHPDDETIGTGGLLLEEGGQCCVVHLTDGAPNDMRDAISAGFVRREDYAAARRHELSRALEVASVEQVDAIQLDVVDQESVFHAARLARAVADAVAAYGPTVIATHTYEGGHPDHDTAALVVRAAASLLRRAGGQVPPLIEFPSYHRDEVSGAIEVGRFQLPEIGQETVVRLSEDRQRKKRRMMECFRTQQRVLAMFDPAEEHYRLAIRRSFNRAPHGGTLHYETLGWSIDGEIWRRQAMAALDELHLDAFGEPRT